MDSEPCAVIWYSSSDTTPRARGGPTNYTGDTEPWARASFMVERLGTGLAAAALARGLAVRQQRIKQQHAGAGDDRGVGHVEVGPVIAEDVDLNEVDDRAVENAVVNVAERAAENERESDGRERELAAETQST